MGGTFKTKRKVIVEFKLPEFSELCNMNAKVHVDDNTKPEDAQYDMIMGTDLLTTLGIDMSFSKKAMSWDDIIIPMKNKGSITEQDAVELIYDIAKEPSTLKISEDRHNEIIK